MLNENQITNILSSYLLNEGCRVMSKQTTTQKGIDLIVTDKNGITLYIEVKGGTSSRAGSSRYDLPFNSKQIPNHIGKAILATFKAMEIYGTEGCKYAMAFPDTISHETALKAILSALQKLNIIIYLVSDNGVRILNED